MKKADKESPEIADNGYIFAGKNCGRDKNGVFRCVCGECKEVSDIYELFRGKIAEQKKIRRLTDADVAKMTGYKTSTIRAFMAGSRENEKIATAIAQALGIER